MANPSPARCICGECWAYWLTETVGICRRYGMWVYRSRDRVRCPVPPADKQAALKVLFERLEGAHA